MAEDQHGDGNTSEASRLVEHIQTHAVPKLDRSMQSKVNLLQGDVQDFQRLTSNQELSKEQVEEVAYQLQHLLSANLESAKKRENQDVVTIEFPEEDVLGRKEYFGEIYQDLRSGLGVMYWHDGTIYQGQWLNDMSDGLGSETYPDKSCYKGQFSKDSRDGVGVFTSANGSVYLGEWRDGERHGTGIVVMVSPNGSYMRFLCTFESGHAIDKIEANPEDPRCAALLEKVEEITNHADDKAEKASALADAIRSCESPASSQSRSRQDSGVIRKAENEEVASWKTAASSFKIRSKSFRHKARGGGSVGRGELRRAASDTQKKQTAEAEEEKKTRDRKSVV